MEISLHSTEVIYIIFSFLVATIIAFATTPIAKLIARRVGAVDYPSARRVNKVPMPRMGGMAIFYGFLVSVLCFVDIGSPEMRGILLGAVIIVVLGALDDVYQLPAWVKFAVQIAAAVLVVCHGVDVTVITNPFREGSYIHLGVWGYPVTVLWIVGVTNAVNLMDGLDGLAVGISAIACFALFIIAIFTGMGNIAVLIAAVIGGCLGFLPYNSHPASIFMGDTGSNFLGFIMATISIQGLFKSYAVVSLLIPLMILGLPIFDTSFTIMRRMKNGQSIFQPDRGHLHHRLMDSGFSHQQTVYILYVISALAALSAVVLLLFGSARAMILIFAIVIFALATLAFTGFRLFSVHKQEASHAVQEALFGETKEQEEAAQQQDKEEGENEEEEHHD